MVDHGVAVLVLESRAGVVVGGEVTLVHVYGLTVQVATAAT